MCVTCGAPSELVRQARQGPPSTWHRSTQPTNQPPAHLQRPICFCCHDHVDGTSSTGAPQIVLKVHRSNDPHNGPHSTLLGACVAPQSCDMSVSPPRQSQTPRSCSQRPASRRLHWAASCLVCFELLDCLAVTHGLCPLWSNAPCACPASSAVTRGDQSPAAPWVSKPPQALRPWWWAHILLFSQSAVTGRCPSRRETTHAWPLAGVLCMHVVKTILPGGIPRCRFDAAGVKGHDALGARSCRFVMQWY